MTFRSLLAF